MVGIARRDPVRSNVPGTVHVRPHLLPVVPVSRQAFRRNQPEYPVRGLRVRLYMAERELPVRLHAGGAADAAAPEKSHIEP